MWSDLILMWYVATIKTNGSGCDSLPVFIKTRLKIWKKWRVRFTHLLMTKTHFFELKQTLKDKGLMIHSLEILSTFVVIVFSLCYIDMWHLRRTGFVVWIASHLQWWQEDASHGSSALIDTNINQNILDWSVHLCTWS